MMAQKTTSEPAAVPARDPYAIHTIEQLFMLFNGGEFLKQFMLDHQELMQQLLDHNEEYGHKGAKGSFSINVSYELGGPGDLGMKASAEFKGPKKPASAAAAYVDHSGQLTLYSPMMKRMQGGVRDITPHDPETGEVRDV